VADTPSFVAGIPTPSSAPPVKRLTPAGKAWAAFWDRILLRISVFYAVLLGAGWFIYGWIPKDESGMPVGPLAELLGASPEVVEAAGKLSKKEIIAQMMAGNSMTASRPTTIAISTLAAIVSAILLSIPVAWTYMHTRRKKGYAQATVQALLILPLVIAGAAMLLKHSVALAFGLGAIAAAIKFRSSVDDTKDAAFIFLCMVIGLAAGVEIAVATMISMMFNYMVIILWYLDFGRAPARLEGDLAKKRLERATAIANRTGAFVARLDEEVLKSMAPEQLEALAERARKRKAKMLDDEDDDAVAPRRPSGPVRAVSGDYEAMQVLRVYASDPVAARSAVEGILAEYLVDWRFIGAASQADGTHWIEYSGRLAPTVIPPTVLYDVRTRSAPHVIRCELKPRGIANA
jgi:hypothetical protein